MGDSISFTNVTGTGGRVISGDDYYVIFPTTDTFQLSTFDPGSSLPTIDILEDGSATTTVTGG